MWAGARSTLLLLLLLLLRRAIHVSGEAGEVRSLLSGRCMQVPKGSHQDSVPLTQYSCHDQDHYKFDTVPVGPGSYFQLRAQHSGKCVGVLAGSYDSGALVVQESCDKHSESQMWRIHLSGDGHKQLVVRHSDYCMNVAHMNDANNAALEVWPCADGAMSNFWDVTYAPPTQPLPSEYVRMISVNSGRCAEIGFGSRRNGRRLTQYSCHEKDHYQISLMPVQGMYYQMRFRHSGKCVGIERNSTEIGAYINQDECVEGHTSQMWKIMDLGGQGHLMSKHSKLCISVGEGSTENGAILVQGACEDDLPSSLWRFETADTKMYVEPFVGNYVQILSKIGGKCAEMPHSSLEEGSAIKQYSCHHGEHFQFVIKPRGGYYQFQLRHSELCLGVLDRSTEDGQPIVQYACDENEPSQLWMVHGPPTGHQFVAKHSGKCFNLKGAVNRNGVEIIQNECTPDADNSWTFQEHAVMRNADHLIGKYVTMVNDRSGRCVQIPHGTTHDDAPMVQYTCYENARHFQFRFFREGDYYSIQMRHSEKCVDVRGGSKAENARIVQATCNPRSHSQLWYMKGPSDKVQIVNRHSGMCLYADFGNNGSHLIQYPCLDSNYAKWSLKQVDVVPTRSLNLFGFDASLGWNGPYQMTIVAVAAANLPDGRILTWSAYSRMNYGTGARETWTSIFDPSTNESSEALIKHTDHDMFCPGTAVLPDGRIAITGGSRSEAFTLYDPTWDFWYKGPNMHITRGYHSMTMLADGRVFTLGGSWSGGIGGKDGEVWDPETNEWEHKTGIQADGTLLTNDIEGVFRSDNHMWLFAAPNGKIFHAGPSTRLHWMTMEGDGTVIEAGIRGVSDAMNGNAVMYDIGKILVMGGAPDYTDSNAINRAYVIDINDGDKVTVTETGSLFTSRAFHDSVVLPSGDVVTVGGQERARIFKDDLAAMDAEIWSPITGQWTVIPGMAIPRTYHSVAILMKDGRVWSGGGGLCGSCSTNHFNAEILTPPYLLDPAGNEILDRPVIVNSTESAKAGDIIEVEMDTTQLYSFALVRLSAATHSTNNDLRRIPLEVISQAGATVQLQIPANKAIALAGSYFLFAMDFAGVPSVANILKLDVPPIADMFPQGPLSA